MMAPKIQRIPRSSYVRAVWKNGLGHTDQVAIFPPNATLSRGDFLWRVSTAQIAQASDFSVFPDHDRLLILLQGQGIQLSHRFDDESDPESVQLSLLEPYEFPGDISSRCELPWGAVTDLSVFFRKGQIEAHLEVCESVVRHEWNLSGRWNFAFVQSGSVSILGQTLDTGDAALATHESQEVCGPMMIESTGAQATVVLIEISETTECFGL